MRKLKPGLLIFILCSFVVFSLASGGEALGKDIPKGIWVSIFSKNKVLYSRDAVNELIALCKEAKINQIYLQVYQSGKAYYDSKIADASKYEDMVKSAGGDTIDFLLQEAKNNNIEVFAWINLLSLGQND